MTTIAAYGATLHVTNNGIRLTPSLLAAALGADDRTFNLSESTTVDTQVAPTSYSLGWVQLSGIPELFRFSPGAAQDQEAFVAAVAAAARGEAGGAVPGLNFVGIDVETANADWGSICQIGLVEVIDGAIGKTQCWLCQPPTSLSDFDPANIAIHGIRPEDVADAPPFAEVMAEVVAAVGDVPLVAHNAQFDFTAFSRACAAAKVPTPEWDFACSLAASRAAKLGVVSHRLPVVAKFLDVSLRQHHDAAADAEACAGILVNLALRAGYSGSLKDVFSSFGFSMGNLNDKRVYPVLNNPPSTRRADTDNSAPAESTPQRRSAPQPRWAKAATPEVIPEANKDADPNHPLFGHNVTLTGDFEPFDKGLLWEKMADAGATIGKNVTKKTTMLVMGPWDSVTSKQKRAEELIDKGQDIVMWQSAQLFDALGLSVEDEGDDQPPF
ncbi:DNA polymerase III epsilon subunit-like 3'-5' exonuclease [Corynebacterium mustelae]|uniref:DNA polymerase III epsilon subunit-like 3'-5' exonuclease n=1 Tax=Corynebacterium mustelae TaxID=571915 RepID=A0A0G3H3J5_9CORY|nr:exonuclease domain-containing protein [Corynebacterium mustelae]AKK06403.1 DNA polymerase III epsilon subunit-like 3'-5' exonuclease [Corynebacterium mustelae]